MNVIRPDAKEPATEFSLAPTQYGITLGTSRRRRVVLPEKRFESARNRYVTSDGSRQNEFEFLCQAAALRHLLVHSVITALLGAVVVGIIR